MPVKDPTREIALDAIAAHRKAITQLCREVHNDPELAFEEHRAAERIAGFLESHGFTVERGVGRLPTAFHARYEHLDPEHLRKGARHAHVGLIAEYDALPEVGHAHGHPLGLATMLATALALKATFSVEHGTISVFGCPASESGGKLPMAQAGLFSPLDAAIGAHPAPPGEGFFYTTDSSGNTLGSARVTISYSGDGDVAAAVARLRESLAATPLPTQEGESVRVVEEQSESLLVETRARSRARIVHLMVALQEAARNAVDGTDLELSFGASDVYDDMVVSRVIARRANTYAFNLGFKTDASYKMPVGEPTDWGNLSYETPTFQAFFPVTKEPSDAVWGDASFTAVSATDAAFDQAFSVAEPISFAALDLLRDLDFRSIADNQLVKELAKRGEQRQHRRWTGLHPVRPKQSSNGAKGPKLVDFKIVKQDGGAEPEQREGGA